MKRVIDFPERDRIRDEAADWVARLDAGELTAEELKQLRDFAKRSPQHRAELQRLAEMWDNLDVLKLCGDSLSPPPQLARPRRWLPATLAAGLATVAVVAVWTWRENADHAGLGAPATTSYATQIGEQRTVSLPDGSSIRMNTNSRLEVAYSELSRKIRLQQGEAYFSVAKSADRPFVVDAGRNLVTAVGTAFTVRLETENVTVTVDSGRVAIASKEAQTHSTSAGRRDTALAVLQAGQSALVTTELESLETLEPEALNRSLAWRDGMLIFDGSPLEDVIGEVSRYTSTEIVISDPVLRNLRIGGYFRASDTAVLLGTLETNFGIRVERKSDDLVYLRSGTR